MKLQRSRDFWIGAGGGVFATALLAGCLGFIQPADTTSAAVTDTSGITEGQLKSVALAKGYVLISSKSYSQQQTKLQEQLQIVKAQGFADGKKAAADPPSSINGEIWVYIPSGASVTDIANLLMAAGVLKDGNAFLRIASEKSEFIHSGSMHFPLKGDPTQILQILTAS